MDRNQKGKHLLAIWLTILLFVNPLAGAVAAAENASSAELFQSSLSYFGSMFNLTDAAGAAEELDPELGELVEEGLFDPFLDLFGRYFGGLLKDERFKETLNQVLDEILADERIAAFDTTEFLSGVLREERLAVILGEVIADYLRDEDLLTFLDQLTGDIEKLLKDKRFTGYLNNVVIRLLKDERINDLVFEIIDQFMKLPETLLSNLQDQEAVTAITGFIADVLKLFIAPLEELKNDKRVAGSLDEIIKYITGDEDDPAAYPGLAAVFAERLANDNIFQDAKEQLLAVFTTPLLGDPDSPEEHPGLIFLLANNLQQDEALSNLLDQLVKEITEDQPLSMLLEQLNDELEQLSTEISDNIFKAIDFYSDGIPLPEREPGAPSTKTDVRLQIAAEDIVGDFLMHWMDCLVWVMSQSGGLDSIMEPYFGENSPYLAAVKEALLKAVDEEGEVLLQMFNGYLGAVDPNKVIAGIMEQWGGLLQGAVDDAVEKGLTLDLLEIKIETLMEVMGELLEGLPLPISIGNENSGENGEDGFYKMVKDLLQGIALELPFDTVAELIDKDDIGVLVQDLFSLVDKLPLETFTPYLRENADELGYNIATMLLGGLADLVETPEDPRHTEIMTALRSEERLRQFYLDLGGTQPEKITSESSNLEIIMAVLMEVAGDEDRLDRFKKEFQQSSESLMADLVDYGKLLRENIGHSLQKIFPFMEGIFSALSFFSSPGDLAGVTEPGSITRELRSNWALIAQGVQESDAAGFVDQSMARFLIDHNAVSDFATEGRMSVINYFFAELSGAEPLKELAAGDSAAELPQKASHQLLSLRTDLASKIRPRVLADSINQALAGLLGRGKIRLNINSMGLSSGEGVETIAGAVEEATSTISKNLGDMAVPLANLPADLFEDPRIGEALAELALYIPDQLLNTAALLMEDQRLHLFIRHAVEEFTDAYLAAVEALLTETGPVTLADGTVYDGGFEEALEDFIAHVLSDEEFSVAIGDLVNGLLSDNRLIGMLEHALHQSRIIAIGWPWQGINPYFLINAGPGGDEYTIDESGQPVYIGNNWHHHLEPRGHTWEEYKPGDPMWNPDVTPHLPVHYWVGPPEGVEPSPDNIHEDWRPEGWEFPEPLYTEPDTWGGPDLRVWMQGFENDPDEDTNPLYYNQYAGHPELPEPFEFITIVQNAQEYQHTGAYVWLTHWYFEMAANNGLFAFTENFIDWFDPEVAFGPEGNPIAAPGEALRQALAGYLNEERMRRLIAEPVAASVVATGLDLAGGEEPLLKEMVMNSLDHLSAENPLVALAGLLRDDRRLSPLFGENVLALSERITALLQDNEEITGLLDDTLALLRNPLDTLAPHIKSSAHARELVAGTEIEVNLGPLKPLLRVDPDTLAVLSAKVRHFPVNNISRFLRSKDRAYKIGYTTSDLKSRFIGNLLMEPDLIRFETDLINEQVATANYGLVQGIFNTVNRIISNERLTEFTGEKLYESIVNGFAKLKAYLHSLFS